MDITIIIITYKSEKIIYDFINKIPSNLKTIIVENSQNNDLKNNPAFTINNFILENLSKISFLKVWQQVIIKKVN